MRPPISVCHLTVLHSHADIRIFRKECVTLVEAGFSVSLLAPAKSNSVDSGVQRLALPLPRGLLGSYTLDMLVRTIWYAWWRAMKLNADVYHFHDPQLIPIGLLLKAQGKRVIYDSHEHLPSEILESRRFGEKSRQLISRIVETMEGWSARRLDRVIAATPTIRDYFRKLGARCTDINNYPLISELNWLTEKAEIREQRVLYVGYISRIRCVFETLQAAALSPIPFTLCGGFETQKLRSECLASPLWSNVEFLGAVPREQALNLMKTSAVGLVLFHPTPNNVNSQPNKLFEYMAAGLPIVCSNFPLWRSIVVENRCGLCVDPSHPEAIANAIQYIVEHPEEAKTMGENGRRLVRECFNWREEGRKLVQMYNGFW